MGQASHVPEQPLQLKFAYTPNRLGQPRGLQESLPALQAALTTYKKEKKIISNPFQRLTFPK